MHKARFVGTRKDLTKDLGIVKDFPFASYVGNDGFPVLFADTEEDKQRLFKECEQLGIEVLV